MDYIECLLSLLICYTSLPNISRFVELGSITVPSLFLSPLIDKVIICETSARRRQTTFPLCGESLDLFLFR